MYMLSLKSIIVSMLIMLPAFVSAQDSIRTNKIVVTDTINRNTKVDTHKNRFIKRLKQKKNGLYGGNVYFGFAQAINAPKEVDLSMSASNEIGFELGGYRWFNHKKDQYFSVGLGFDWRNFRMTGRERFVQNNKGELVVEGYPESATSTISSRIKVFSVNLPFRYTFLLPQKWSMDVAAILNFNTFASAESFYKVQDETMQVKHHVKESYKDLHQKVVTVDFMARVHWRGLGLYVKYSPCKVINQDFGPSFTPISTGIMLGI